MNWNKDDNNLGKNLQSHQLDSSIYYRGFEFLNSKIDNLYDKKKDILLRWNWDSDNEKWKPDSYTVYHFSDNNNNNNNNNIVNQSYNIWNGDTQNLDEKEPLVYRTFVYNENDFISELQEQDYQSFKEDRLLNTTKYVYDSNGLLNKLSLYHWNFDLDSLELTFYRVYKHNQDNLVEQIIDWKYKEEYGWYPIDSTYMTYNEKGLLETEVRYGHGPILEDYSFGKIYYYDYLEDNSLLQIREASDLNDTLFTKTKFEYHQYGSLDSERKFYFNESSVNPLWTGYYRDVYQHNENVSSVKIKVPRTKFSGSFFDQAHYFENHMLLRELHYVDGGNPPERIESSAKHFYSEIIMTNSEVIKPSVSNEIFLAPNPSSSIISIKGENLSGEHLLNLLNITGKNVLSKSLHHDEKIDISHLNSGLYFYSIYKDGINAIGKIVIEK